jgi:hypothetical protein
VTHDRARAIALLLLASPAIVIAALTLDARHRRAKRRAEEPALALVAARLPTSDLALSGGARWLRAPSLEEPGAAFADGPALPDPDPAGGAMAPPVDVWSAIETRSAGRRRSTPGGDR